MSSSYNPQHLDVQAFAQSRGDVSGEADLQSMHRLRADCTVDVTGKVTWSAQGALRQASDGQGAVWLYVQARTQVPLACQRCLQKVMHALVVDRSFRFVRDEATALAQDDSSEEDLLALSNDFDLWALIEDELLMALPLVPMHENCQSEYTPTLAADAQLTGEAKPSPFAVLASMRISKD
jgi:uncharacterized protein